MSFPGPSVPLIGPKQAPGDCHATIKWPSTRQQAIHVEMSTPSGEGEGFKSRDGCFK